jgi:hypothetical protein
MHGKTGEGEFNMMYFRLFIGVTSWILVSSDVRAQPSVQLSEDFAATIVGILERREECNALNGCPKKESTGIAAAVLGGGLGPDKDAAEYYANQSAHRIACAAAKADALAKLPACDEGCKEQSVFFNACTSDIRIIESSWVWTPEFSEAWLKACKLLFPDRDCTREGHQGPYYAFAEASAEIKVTRYCIRADTPAQCADKAAEVSED